MFLRASSKRMAVPLHAQRHAYHATSSVLHAVERSSVWKTKQNLLISC
jgi:hypothetical protein